MGLRQKGKLRLNMCSEPICAMQVRAHARRSDTNGAHDNLSICVWAHDAFAMLMLLAGSAMFAVLSLASVVLTVKGRDFSTEWALISTYNMLPVIVGLVIWCLVVVALARRQELPSHKAFAHIGF